MAHDRALLPDALTDLGRQLRREGVALHLANVRRPAHAILERAGTTAVATVDEAVHPAEVSRDHPPPQHR